MKTTTPSRLRQWPHRLTVSLTWLAVAWALERHEPHSAVRRGSLALGETTHRGAPMSPIEMRNLTAAYRDHPAVHHVPGTFEAGPLIAVVEPNGAGKSNLLGAIAGQLKHAGCSRNSGRGCRTRSWNTR